MITYLKVRNLAIVEEFAIEPGPGLNVLTGETGAGKSLLIDSLEFLRGARSSSDMIRSGTDRMSAEAVFSLPASSASMLAAAGIDVDVSEGSLELVVKRDFSSSGRGKTLVNGSPLTVRELATAMEPNLEIHGQHEGNLRVAGQTYRELVDDYAGHGELLRAVEGAWSEWRLVAAQLDELTNAQRDRTLRLDLLRYQQEEIGAARLSPGEEETLRAEKMILSHAREMIDATSSAHRLLDDDELSAVAQLSRSIHALQPLSREIQELHDLVSQLQESLYQLQEVSRSVGNLSESVRHDPERLEEVEERLVTIERLNRKYGGSIDAVLQHLSEIQDEHERLSDYESSLLRFQRAADERQAIYRRAADKLTASRRKAASSFQTAIQTELSDLAMERTTVRIISEDIEPGPYGTDRIEILISPNRGEEPKPMQRIASGGELSRIQLAVAAALFKGSQNGSGATLVFDEIDAGIGGRVAEVVGRKLQELAQKNQVICVTHLPQIASFGATHFYVWKEESSGHTRARIRRLDEHEERVSELARMLGGESIAASAVLHARELLESARGRSNSPKVRSRT